MSEEHWSDDLARRLRSLAGRYVTDEQWLELIATVGAREDVRIFWPRHPGDPVLGRWQDATGFGVQADGRKLLYDERGERIG